ncbi:UDP-glucose 4-epimerase GalE [Candidatus Saccharibacteria bacterium]|nr:UDP-glucose 4-epimerase GalE [Candidatus Saccharibacteria bacterium]
MQKVLVTGGTGYIGSHTVVELLNSGYDVDIVDNLSNSKIEVINAIEKITNKRPNFHKLDLLDKTSLDSLIDNNHYVFVLHFAGLKAVGESVEKPLLYYRTNLDSTINIIEAMLVYGVNNFVFSSSATVYGQQESPECIESMQTGSGITNPYGRTKYMIEEMLKDVHIAHPDFSATLLRYFNPIGNHPSGLIGEDPNGIPNNIMPVIMRVATGKIKELSIYGNDYDTPDGTCRRDYIHVVDLAKGHLAAMQHAKPGISVYNLGTGKPTSVLELLAAFETAAGRKMPHIFAPRRSGDVAEMWANPNLANQELNWHTDLTIADAMRDTLKFLESQR